MHHQVQKHSNVDLHTARHRAQDHTDWSEFVETAMLHPGACYWWWWKL